ncbi:cupin domain-containing protein [Kordiimonas marina]|uniref:cupin domain-containing protein n=1 Tax=Kordiimonas marina TaxID=2872312 RepID=UPI001FF5A9FC|nr:cupin domain-containing protein [Kordiimonas marina]MCJ9430143.1 cupin domain-containing protein [Kordiimonas marina]
MKFATTFAAVAGLATLTALTPALAPAWADDGGTHPVKMSKAQIAGQIFTDHKPVVMTHKDSTWGPYVTHDVEAFLSTDKKMDSGMYKSGPVRMEFKDQPYGVDEFMYFLKGGVTLTSADGTVTKIGPGDAVTIGRNWKGVWESKGYTKIYVIYSPDGPLSE